jgi:sugar phosphate isomerase/epimerase
VTDSRILSRIGLSGIVTPTQSTVADCELYAGAGIGAIGVWLHKLERGSVDGFWIPEQRIDEPVLADTKAALERSGLIVSHLVLSGFYTEPELDDRIAHTRHTMEVAGALGARVLVLAPGRRQGRGYEETRDYCARAISRVLEQAPPASVKLALEPIIPWQSDYLNTLAEAIELAELVDHPDLGVYPDTFHLWRTGTLLEDIERAGARILGVHLNDARPDEDHNCLPGDGELPLVEIVRAIEATGYTGTYDNELMYPGSLVSEDPERFAPEAVVGRCVAAMAAVLEPAFQSSPATA